ncbi:hypothetical protein ACTXT7_011623 [Hymenolepis weldensis]
MVQYDLDSPLRSSNSNTITPVATPNLLRKALFTPVSSATSPSTNTNKPNKCIPTTRIVSLTKSNSIIPQPPSPDLVFSDEETSEVLDSKSPVALTESAQNVLAADDFDDFGDPPSPSWLNDDAEVFGSIDQTESFNPNTTSTQAFVTPKPPVKSPPRSSLKTILKNSTSSFTPTPQPIQKSSSSLTSASKNSPVFTPVTPKTSQARKSTSSSKKKSSLPSKDTVAIPTTFLKAINSACDVIQSLNVEKLLSCFGAKTNSITNLLSARREFHEWQTNSAPKQEEKAPSQERGAINDFDTNDINNWNDFDFFHDVKPEPSPSTLSSAKQVKLAFPPEVGIISRPKPKTSQLEADTGEGNAFLPLGTDQSKWARLHDAAQLKPLVQKLPEIGLV